MRVLILSPFFLLAFSPPFILLRAVLPLLLLLHIHVSFTFYVGPLAILRSPSHPSSRCLPVGQVDIVGTPERAPTSASTLPAHAPRTSKPGCVVVNAEGCYAEADPNVAPLRALECINL